jgi:dipeptidyl-peptidase-3
MHAYNLATPDALLEEFCYSAGEITLIKQYGNLADDLHVDMHEVIGHGSGQINPGIGTPRETLKNYASTIEEARADLVALYYAIDPKLIEIGAMPTIEVGKVEYNKYIRGSLLTQLQRIKPGEDIEEAHMRNRMLIAAWAYERGKADKVIEKIIRDDKTFFVVNDCFKLRELFGELLSEVQRITSEGDFEAARNLVETYGVKVDRELHTEVLRRFEKLNIAPYKGFINPVLVPKYENGKLIDVLVDYPDDFTKQMLYYAERYSFLPNSN